MTWHKEYDETYETHYYYNDETGESRWDAPADDDADAEGLVAPADDDTATRVRRRGSCVAARSRGRRHAYCRTCNKSCGSLS